MLTRLIGLTAVTAAAAVGVVIAAPVAYGVELKRRLHDQHWDWDTAPVPASVAHQEAA